MADWGKGVNNDIGWGQGGTNDIGYGSIYAVSNSGITLLLQDESFFLNTFAGASLGLSLVKLRKEYTGFCIKVRRSSDNAVQDIGFVDGVLDTANLLAFAGSGDAFVTIIYDQVGTKNMTQTTANLQGQIVSNGSVILKGGKPCIIRSANDNGGYLSSYAPNDGATIKGMFYIGSNEGKRSMMFGSRIGAQDAGIQARSGFTDSSVINLSLSNTAVNATSKDIGTQDTAFTELNKHFLLYCEIEFNFGDNKLGLGYRNANPITIGMFTFQELVIFENTDNATAKQNNRNDIYNIY
jgi:hypothetical protein